MRSRSACRMPTFTKGFLALPLFILFASACRMSAFTKGFRALLLFISFASAVTTIAAACVDGEFRQSAIDGPCPDGMAVVTSQETCVSAITKIDGKAVVYDRRSISCRNMLQGAFGCYMLSIEKSRIQFNPLGNTPGATYGCGAGGETSERQAGTPLTKASVCECKPTTTTAAATTAAATTRVPAAKTSNGTKNTTQGTMTHGDVTHDAPGTLSESTINHEMHSASTRATTATTTLTTTTAATSTSNDPVFVADSSRCPIGTVVLADQAQCAQVGHHSIDALGGDQAVYAGEIGPRLADKRPPGCFVDAVIESVECTDKVCINFNDKAGSSQHDQLAETTDYLAICVHAPEATTTIANIEHTTTTKGSSAPIPTTSITTTTTTTTLAGCGPRGKLQSNPYCPDTMYKIMSIDSCAESAAIISKSGIEVVITPQCLSRTRGQCC